MSARMEVLIDGEWQGIPLTEATFEFDRVEFPRPADDSPAAFTASFELQGQGFGRSLRDLIVRAEREAREARARRRWWLRFPYTVKGAHDGLG